MKIAILGGSFNPPHVCHTFICCYVLATADVDQMWVVPCYQHAFGKPLEAFHHRFAMCELALAPLRESCVKVSAIEQERQGTSWTIDTVRYLRARHPEHEFVWVVGSDVLTDLGQWKDVEELNTLISFLVVPRSGFSQPSEGHVHPSDGHCQSMETIVPEASPRPWTPSGDDRRLSSPISIGERSLNVSMQYVETPEFQLPGISSSLIRQRLQAGQSITPLVSKPVAEYIQTHQLYTSLHV